MAKKYPIQQSFAAGEISPQMLSRTDLPGYKQACAELTNMVPRIQGAAYSRPGLKYVGEPLTAAENYCRMIPFKVNFGESYMAIITTEAMYIADKTALLTIQNLVTDAYFSSGGDTGFWVSIVTGPGTVTFPHNKCQLLGGVGGTAAVQQSLSGPINPANLHIGRITTTSTRSFRLKIGTSAGLTDIADLTLRGREHAFSFTPNSVSVFIEIEAGGVIPLLIENVTIYDAVTGGDLIQLAHPWNSAAVIEDIQYEDVPGSNEMFFVQRDRAPQVLTYAGPASWTLANIPFVGIPWNTSPLLHPGTIAIFKGRLYLGGTRDQQTRVWASVAGDYYDFNPSILTDDDTFFVDIDRAGAISWMRAGKALFAGLDTGEHVIFGDNNLPPTPSNVDTDQQSAYGSYRTQGHLVGEQVFFVTADRRRVYASSYVRDALGWISEDVTYAAEHISAGLINDVTHASTPHNNLWFSLEDGTIVGMVYDPRKKILGWHKHNTQGEFMSLAVMDDYATQDLWTSAIRGGLLRFERTDVEGPYMDSFAEIYLDPPSTDLTGLDHLDGRTVQILADGAVHPDKIVVPGGTLTLDYPASHVYVGLGFTSKLETAPIEMLTQDEGSASFMKSWNKIFVRVLDSALPLINGIRPPDRSEETPMGTAEPIRSQDIEVANLGWDLKGQITIEQDLPAPLTVSGVYGELDQDNIS